MQKVLKNSHAPDANKSYRKRFSSKVIIIISMFYHFPTMSQAFI